MRTNLGLDERRPSSAPIRHSVPEPEAHAHRTNTRERKLGANPFYSAVNAFFGLILDNVTRGRQEMKRLFYLGIEGIRRDR